MFAYTQEDGTVAVCRTEFGVPSGTPFIAVVGELPDRAYRDAWRIVGNEVVVDDAVAAGIDFRRSKLAGVEFQGVLCSATSEDMYGLASIRHFLQAGGSANFEFSNGNVLALSANNMAEFEAVWVPFRQSFFS
jgi:hypothetical protein